MPKIIIVNATTYAQGRASFDLAVEFNESTEFDLRQGLDGELYGCKYTVFWTSDKSVVVQWSEE